MPDLDHTITVNGTPHCGSIALGLSLLRFLRDRLGLTGTKEACGSGECGACTVLVGGVPQLACITLCVRVREPVTTIEGLAEEAHGLREAFARRGGFQCGFCTSGQIVHAVAILRSGLPADRDEAETVLRHQLSGNICRCTGYVGIVDAILDAAARESSCGLP